jgi:hypothetical protein
MSPPGRRIANCRYPENGREYGQRIDERDYPEGV